MRNFIVLSIVIANCAFGGDYIKNHVVPPVVINRMVSFKAAPVKNHGNLIDPIALPLQGVINNGLQPPRWRQFQFADNTEKYIQPAKSISQVRSAATIKTYVGIVDLSFKIEPSGSVTFINAGEENERSTKSTSDGYSR